MEVVLPLMLRIIDLKVIAKNWRQKRKTKYRKMKRISNVAARPHEKNRPVGRLCSNLLRPIF